MEYNSSDYVFQDETGKDYISTPQFDTFGLLTFVGMIFACCFVGMIFALILTYR